MNTGTMTALLLLGMLAPVTTALACPVDDAVAVVQCVAGAIHPDGDLPLVNGNGLQQGVVDLHDPCFN